MSNNLGVTRHLASDFDEFDRHVKAMARGLLGMGAKKGNRVGVIMGNNRYAKPWRSIRDPNSGLMGRFSSYAVLQLACERIGAHYDLYHLDSLLTHWQV